MDRCWLIIDQIEQSHDMIVKDETSYYRMALLLLDNAVEVLMYRTIQNELQYSEWYSTLANNVKGLPQNDEIKKIHDDIHPKIISPKRKKQILKYFDEKTKFLSEERYYVERPIARVLRIIHRYRNELYHRDVIRKEIIRPIVYLSYEIACDLLSKLKPGSYRLLDDQQTRIRITKYRVESGFDFARNGIFSIAEQLKNKLLIELSDLKTQLVEHLNDRIENFESNLDFLMTDGFHITSQEEALRQVQFFENWKKVAHERHPHFQHDLNTYVSKYNMNSIETWKESVARLQEHASKLALIDGFAQVEETFEELESLVTNAAIDLDGYIQSEVDRLRGK